MVAAVVPDFYMDTIKVPHYNHKNYAFFKIRILKLSSLLSFTYVMLSQASLLYQFFRFSTHNKSGKYKAITQSVILATYCLYLTLFEGKRLYTF